MARSTIGRRLFQCIAAQLIIAIFPLTQLFNQQLQFAPLLLQANYKSCLESKWDIFVTIAFWEEEVPLKYLLKGVLTTTKNRRSMTDRKQSEIYANEVKQEVALEVEVKNSVAKIESCV